MAASLRYPDDDEQDLEPAPPRPKEAARRLRALFEEVDRLMAPVSCAACGGCCQLARTGREPYLFPIELRLVEQTLAAAGRALPGPRPDGACPLLDASERRCSLYEARPFGCRTFFCDQGRGALPPNARLHALSARLTALSDLVDPGAKPEPLRELLARARRS